MKIYYAQGFCTFSMTTCHTTFGWLQAWMFYTMRQLLLTVCVGELRNQHVKPLAFPGWGCISP